jgi:hypothetical protein
MTAAHQVSDVDGGCGLGCIGSQQNAKAIWEAVFSNAFNLSNGFEHA